MSNVTLVSGLWNIGREERNFEEIYIPRFKAFLKTDVPMILFLPQELHELVWEIRDQSNTFIKSFELEDFKTNLFAPHWDKCQGIRNSPEWKNTTGEHGWLPNSPQCKYEWYNPLVMSKMFMMNDARIYNNFNTEFFFWVDAGLNMTVHDGALTNPEIYNKAADLANPFLFLSFPYKPAGEVHGFREDALMRYTKCKTEYVCRGGFFGGHKEAIERASTIYYSLLERTLSEGVMGTEETLFTIMAYNEPQTFRRYMLDDNGLIVKFYDKLNENNVELEPIDKANSTEKRVVTQHQVDNLTTNLYILTFNFPEQLKHTLATMRKTPEWLHKPNIVLLDNSTDEQAIEQNKILCEEESFEYINLGGNTGICGGRQAAAEHFDKSDADYMFFFEDDMTLNPPEIKGQYCRNGFQKYIENTYGLVHKIMEIEKYDFLKLSFTEVYMDNNKQCSWYNIPQDIRERDWPEQNTLPVQGLDKNSPDTAFTHIKNLDGTSYIEGDIYYANWPMIVSKEGNRKIFLENKWEYPYEQTWMSHVYQKQKEGHIKAAVLLASPIWHDRIKYYKPEERKENNG